MSARTLIQDSTASIPAPVSTPLDDLVTRLAARISAGRDEIAPFAGASAAIDALAERFFRNQRVVIARPTREEIASRAWRTSRTAKEVSWLGASAESRRDAEALAGFDALVSAARDADTLVLTSPLAVGGRVRGALAPRDLLLLRSRAPRPVIVLDLLDEELARAPLTQPALLLPGTVFLRGFGQFWREAGARSVADTAFVAGPSDLIASLDRPGLDERLAAEAVWDLDRVGIDRAVQERASAARGGFLVNAALP
ncbi:MAG: hypothetical protein ACK5C3_05775 [bacterium]